MSSKNTPKKIVKPPFGRPKGTGKYHEPTKPMRIPMSLESSVIEFLAAHKAKRQNAHLDDSFYARLDDAHIFVDDVPLSLPLGGTKLEAGFGNMIEDWMEDELEIKDYLIDDKEQTFFKIIGGLSMNLAGLLPGFVACVDRSKKAEKGDIVMAELNGRQTIKYLGESLDGHPQLIPHSTENFPTVTITEFDDFRIVGVVNTWFARRKKKR